MQFPRPDLREYARFAATALLTLAVLQYAGIFYDDPGIIDWRSLLVLGLILPVFAYLLTVVTGNIERLPDYEKMNRTRK